MSEKVEISVIIPVYNSADCLPALAEQLDIALKNSSNEIILVNDGSSDQSWTVLTELCAKYPKMKAINLSRNFGQNNAIIAGIKNCKGEFGVIMDDDLQHDPKDILSLVNECKKGIDICFGNFDNLKQKNWKNAGSQLNGKVAEWFIGKPKDLYLSPFKAFRKNIIEGLKAYNGAYPYVDAIMLQLTSSFSQITIQHHDRFKGKGSYGFFKSLRVFINHALSYSVFPLHILSWTGGISALLSMILGVYYLVEYMSKGHRVEGWITITLLILFFGGLILLSLGIIGQYIARMYRAGNFNIPFAVREKINFRD